MADMVFCEEEVLTQISLGYKLVIDDSVLFDAWKDEVFESFTTTCRRTEEEDAGGR